MVLTDQQRVSAIQALRTAILEERRQLGHARTYRGDRGRARAWIADLEAVATELEIEIELGRLGVRRRSVTGELVNALKLPKRDRP